MVTPMTEQRTVIMPFLHSFEPGGVERVALRLCGAWMRDPAVDVRLVMGRDSGPLAADLPAGLDFDMIGSGPVPTAGWETLWLIIVMVVMVRRHRPDVLFAAGNTYAVVAVALKLLLGRACPPVVLKVSNDLARADLPAPARRVYRWWLRVQGRMIDHFTGLAEPMRAEIAHGMGVAGDRITVIDDPALADADVTTLAAIGAARQPAAGRRYLAIGRLAAQKNFPLLVEAFARVAGPRDRLAIIGEGGARGRIEARATALGIADRVSLPGHGAIAPALAAADVFVLSSDYEALPAVVVEALASGLPVIATDCSVSMRGLVGEFGTIVPCADAAALAAAMQAQSPLSKTQHAMAATAMRRFTVERAAGVYGRLFMRLSSRERHEPAMAVA